MCALRTWRVLDGIDRRVQRIDDSIGDVGILARIAVRRYQRDADVGVAVHLLHRRRIGEDYEHVGRAFLDELVRRLDAGGEHVGAVLAHGWKIAAHAPDWCPGPVGGINDLMHRDAQRRPVRSGPDAAKAPAGPRRTSSREIEYQYG